VVSENSTVNGLLADNAAGACHRATLSFVFVGRGFSLRAVLSVNQ
jgi:hypothetical protein